MTDESAVSAELSTILTQMSGLLITQETVRTALDLVVDLAQQTHPATVGAGVSLFRGPAA